MFDVNTQRGNEMNVYKFSEMPSHSSVAATVTMLVSAWFVLAGGAILADHHSEATLESARAVATAGADIPPEARMTIVVEARRAADTL
jgi:hypothetical protein